MKAELIIPIETLRGALRKDGYYFRISVFSVQNSGFRDYLFPE